MAGLYVRAVGAPEGGYRVADPRAEGPRRAPRFTPAFSLSLPALSDAQLSPDGEAVALVVGDQSRPIRPGPARSAPSAVWSVPAGGGEARRLTYGRSDSAPRWSPGRPLAGLPVGPGEGRPAPGPAAASRRRRGAQLTDLKSDIPVGRSFNPLGWFPDGSRVVFPLVDPAPTAERSRIDAGDDRIVFEEEPRLWRLWAVNAVNGDTRAISPPGLQIWEFAISPDGRRIAAIASDAPFEWDWYDARLVVFDVGPAKASDAYAAPEPSPGRETRLVRRRFSRSRSSRRSGAIAATTPASRWSSTRRRRRAGRRREGDRVRPRVDLRADGRLLAAANVEAGGIPRATLETGARTWLWRAEQSVAAFSYARTAGGLDSSRR